LVILLVGLYLLSAFFGWVQAYVMAGVTQRTVYRLRRDVDRKLARLPLSYFDNHPRGDLLSRVTNDIDNIGQSLQQSLTQLITSLLTIVGVLVIMLVISPILAVISLLAVPASLAVTILVVRRSQKQFIAQWASTGALNGQVEEMHTGHAIVKVFGRQREAVARFNEENERLYQASHRAQFISGLIQPSMNFISNLNYVAIAVIGGLRVAAGQLSLGDVVAFIQYTRQFTFPIIQTASIVNVLQSAVASAERVFELMDEGEEQPDAVAAKVLEGPQGAVAFEGVSFRYQPETPLIEDLNLVARAGDTVAIVGPTGAGKTTLVNLLMRFYEIDKGRITVDGIDIRDLTRDNLRRTFGMVLQDTWLFNGTIRENIGYGREGATEAEIVAAAEAAHVDHFVRTLPDGYDTVIDDDATNLSAGEKQLLTIARAFLADPAILILDEATSSVDTRTEVLIQRAMARLMTGRTTFVIAHRLSTIRDADTIVVLNRGQIVEQGTHADLLEQRGFYFDLYNSQFAEALAEAV
jgi:ATP-binding cassette subfamily B protein